MTLVNDDGVFKLQEPVPASLKSRPILHVRVVDEDETQPGADEADGWTMMQSLKGCATDTPPGEHIGRDHDKYLYGR